MRSDLVFGALSHVSNRYQLCQLASKATRKLHKPNTRLQDTTNEVLVRFHSTNPGTLSQAQRACGSADRDAARGLTASPVSSSKLSTTFSGGHFASVYWPLPSCVKVPF